MTKVREAKRDAWVSVVIPTLNAENEIASLLESLQNQTRAPDEIIVIDSSSTDATPRLCKAFSHVTFVRIAREDFDHGGTRDMALRISGGDFILFLTQDAIPADSIYVENILKPFGDESVAMVTGRQVAKRDASETERLTREFNYPDQSFIRSGEDIQRLGIKAFFSSDCCSAYRRTAYLAVGGFEKPILTGEDLIIAALFIHTGYKTAYCGDARALHSHQYTLSEQYARNFDNAANIAMHEELFRGLPVHTEGIRMVRFALGKLLRKGRLIPALYYCVECAVKWMGYRRGLRYRLLLERKLLSHTLNPEYWARVRK